MPELHSGPVRPHKPAPPVLSSRPSMAALPLVGLVALALATGVFLLNRAERYSDEPTSRPPSAQRVGDDYARVAELSRDPRSISLLIGQALYDIGPERVAAVLLPAEPQEVVAENGARMPGGPNADVIVEGKIELLAGVRPAVAEHPARLSAQAADELAGHPRAREYPMGVIAIDAEGAARATYAVVGDAAGERVFVIPAELLVEVTP